MQGVRRVGILGTGSYLPPRVLTNADMEKIVDTNDEWITTRSGIKQRHIADEGVASSDLAFDACKRALDAAGCGAEEIDFIIVATVTPDMVFPSTACLLQDKLGARKAGAVDISAGCSGFVYGLTMGAQMIAAGIYRKVLVVGVEVLSRIINWEDRNTCVLFGDGAGAAVLSEVAEGGILGCSLGADGSGKDLLYMPAGGSLCPPCVESVQGKKHTIHMNGREVFKHAVRVMVEASVDALDKAGLDSSEVDLFIPHQANIRIIEAVAKRLQMPEEKIFVNLQKYGNTSAASIPVALDEAFLEGRIKQGDKIVMVAFGTGLTWGAIALEWVY